eukprot:gene6094-11479_t
MASTTKKLPKIKREIDKLKFKVDELCDHEIPHLGAASPDRKSVYDKCSNLTAAVYDLISQIGQLSLKNEKLPTKEFEAAKAAEGRRLTVLREKLEQISSQLEPDEVEEDYLSKFVGGDAPSVSDANSFDGHHEADGDDYETDESIEVYRVEAFGDFAGEEVGDLQFKKGEILTIITTRDDGWWTAENKDGKTGLVPSTLLKILDDEEDDKEVENKDKPGKIGEPRKDLLLKCYIFELLENDLDYDFYVVNMKTIYAKNEKSFRALGGVYVRLAATVVYYIAKADTERWFVDMTIPYEIITIGKTGTGFKKNLGDFEGHETTHCFGCMKIQLQVSGRDPEQTTVNDVLKAMKAVPSGFRSSTLGIMLKQEEHKTSFWLTPKLSSSNLSFRDLFWDPVNKKLRPRAVKLTRTFSLMGAKFIPLPGAGLEVKSRHVRISFWDGKNVYGNIHTVRAIAVEKDEQSWSFTPRLSVFLPSLYDGECIARINSATENLALLFELNYSYVRTTTEDKGELSAGWCTLPLFEKDGTPIVNKNYELALHGGTPFEKGVDVDAALSLKTSQSLFQSLIRTNRQPRLIVKLTPINRVEKAQFDLLPDLLITCERHIKFIVLYRELLANTYLKDGEPSGEYICDPIMANICKAFDFSDLIDALQMIWNERSKVNLSRSQKRDQAHMLKFFRQCFIESTFSIMNNVKFPPYIWANETAEQERVKFITSYLAEKNSLALMFAPSSTFKPFNTRKVSFDVLSNKSLLNSETERERRPLDNADKIKEENCCCPRLSVVPMAGDFLKGLPSFNKENFSRFHADGVQSKSTNLQQKRNLSSTDNASPSRKVPRLGAASNDDKSTEND